MVEKYPVQSYYYQPQYLNQIQATSTPYTQGSQTIGNNVQQNDIFNWQFQNMGNANKVNYGSYPFQNNGQQLGWMQNYSQTSPQMNYQAYQTQQPGSYIGSYY